MPDNVFRRNSLKQGLLSLKNTNNSSENISASNKSGSSSFHNNVIPTKKNLVSNLKAACLLPGLEINDNYEILPLKDNKNYLKTKGKLTKCEENYIVEDRNCWNNASFIIAKTGDINAIQNELQRQNIIRLKTRCIKKTPLHVASKFGHLDICQLILKHIPDKNPKQRNGWTPLHAACYHGHLKICKLMLETVSDPNPKLSNGKTPLDLAVKKGFLEIVQLFDEHLNSLNSTNSWNVLHYAAENGHFEIFKHLFLKVEDKNPSAKTKSNVTPLHLACKNGHYLICKLITEHIGFENPATQNGITPLHIAAHIGHFELCQLFLQKMDKNHPKTDNGQTPLHLASKMGHLDVCQLLIKHFEDKNPKDNFGWTPLHDCAQKGHLEVFRFIFELVDEKNPSTRKGNTPFMLAVENCHYSICKMYAGCEEVLRCSIL